MQKLARAVIGTNNMDNCSRYCQAPATTGLLFRTVGVRRRFGLDLRYRAGRLVLIVGSNTAESHPVLATRVKRAHKLRGQKLIVSDLRENEMARRADLHCIPRPAPTSSGSPPSPATFSTTALPTPEFLTSGSTAWRSIAQEPGAVHAGIRQQDLRPAGGNAEARGAHDCRSRRASAFCGRWASPSTATAPIPRRRSRICCWSPAITCGRAPARIRCAGTTTCRARAITAPCRTSSPAIRRWTIPIRARFEGAGA
jgi:hypothetical protein